MARRKYRPIPALTTKQLAKFWNRVLKRGPDECWPWTAGCFSNGYGCVSLYGGSYIASRVAFFLTTGVDPMSLYTCHHCDNPPCCNPNHFFAGTAKQNGEDMAKKGRAISGYHAPEAVQGEGNGNSKLTTAEVIEIRQLRRSGTRTMELVHKYGVTKNMINKIVRRDFWKHIPEQPYDVVKDPEAI